jgi:CRP-like cAMP-binding protein
MKLSILNDINLFHNVSDSTLQRLMIVSKYRSYQKNFLILNYDNSIKNFIYIAKGWLKLCRVSLDGEEIILEILHSKQCYGETIILDSQAEQGYMTYAITDAKCVIIPLNVLRELVVNDHNLAINIIHLIASKISLQKTQIEHLSIQNSTQRIACFFLRLMNYKNEETKKSIYLPYHKYLISKKVGCRAETFSRSLVQLHKICGLTTSNSHIYIKNPLMLSNYTCQKCSRTFPCHLNID